MKKITVVLTALAILSACSSGPQMKEDKYAKLANMRTFTYDMPVVWKSVLNVANPYKIVFLDVNDPNKHTLETDWFDSPSSDKYAQTTINGSPQRVPLHVRLKYKITALKRLGGVDVTVSSSEQVEKLDNYGNSKGFSKTSEIDTAHESEVLDKINQALLSTGA